MDMKTISLGFLLSATSLFASLDLPLAEWAQNGEDRREELMPIFAELGYINAVEPKSAFFDVAIVIGGTYPNFHGRMEYLTMLFNEGIQFKLVVVLTDNRPLTKAEKEVLKPGLTTEMEMIESVIHTEFSFPCPIDIRPLDEYLPKKTTAMIVSNQPFVPYHRAMLTPLFPSGSSIEVVGEEAPCNVPIILVLDAIGKTVYLQAKNRSD